MRKRVTAHTAHTAHRRVRWPDENRRQVATRYATAAAKYKQELLAMHPGGPGHQEAMVALRGLNPWAAGAKFEELVRWLGEFDSARTLVEEWPAMRGFVSSQKRAVLVSMATLREHESRQVVYGEREVGGPPPEWMRGWLPLVAEWERRRWREPARVEAMSEAIMQAYGAERIERMVEDGSPFRRFLQSRSGVELGKLGR